MKQSEVGDNRQHLHTHTHTYLHTERMFRNISHTHLTDSRFFYANETTTCCRQRQTGITHRQESGFVIPLPDSNEHTKKTVVCVFLSTFCSTLFISTLYKLLSSIYF